MDKSRQIVKNNKRNDQNTNPNFACHRHYFYFVALEIVYRAAPFCRNFGSIDSSFNQIFRA
jgi:hypothetical protein